MRPGETLTLSDGEGTDYLARILSIDGDAVETEILERTPNQTEPRAKLTLFMAMPFSRLSQIGFSSRLTKAFFGSPPNS